MSWYELLYQKYEREFQEGYHQFVTQHIDLPWYFDEGLPQNKHLTWDLIFENSQKPWNWSHLSKRDDLQWIHVEKHPELPWDWENLSRHQLVTWEIVSTHLDKPWNWELLSGNHNTPFQFSFWTL